ncbi:MAG: outer-membrane immunogenic protein precursor [Methylocystis sp.]|nr:MAG: outer-membrane immunogenic protein precursor [Methylocystis sp.]
MKKIALATTLLAMTAGSALAADLPSTKAPLLPPPPPPPMWTGFYVGLNAGGTWANNNQIWTSGFPLGDPAGPAADESLGIAASVPLLGGGGSGGFIGGGQIGYNYQFYNSFLIGLEADIQGLTSNGAASTSMGVAPVFNNDTGLSFVSRSRGVDYIGTVRGRLGWLFTPTLLLYGTGGFAYGGVTLNSGVVSSELNGFFGPINSTGIAASAFADTRTGWTAGGGVEWMFMPNWSAKVEYLYYDLGTVSINTTMTGFDTGTANPDWFAGVNTRTRFDGHIVRAGLNYHFNWGAAPVVAKY